MGTKKYGFLASVLSTSVLLLLLFFSTVSLVLAPKIISWPTGTIEVTQGGTFTLQHKFEWDEGGAGFYSVALYWWYWGLDNWHFTVDNYKAYFENGDPIECTKSEIDNGDLLSILLRNTVADARNGVFYVDLRLRARGPGGTPHQVTENHPILYTKIRCNETGTTETTPGPVTIKVFGIGVDVTISPTENEGPPGSELTYTVTVKNVGGAKDNYYLIAEDNADWNPTLADNLIENVPPGENRTTTLRITIPDNAIGCTRDNIIVIATSQADNTVKDNDSCIAHATIVLGVDVSISPSYQSGLNGVTLDYTVTVSNTGNVEDTYSLAAADNAGWGPTVFPDSLTVPPWENRTATLSVIVPPNAIGCTKDNVFVVAVSQADNTVKDNDSCIAHATIVLGVDVSISPSYQSGPPLATLNYTVTVANTGNAKDTYDLGASDDAGWSPSVSPTSLTVPPWENRTATLSVTVPPCATGCTNDNITVAAVSRENAEVSDNASCVAHATIVRGVDVSISPENLSGLGGWTLAYTVTVRNRGSIKDSFRLENLDNLGWSMSLDDDRFDNVLPWENRTTTLHVTIPDNAIPCTQDTVRVRATSVENEEVSAEDICIAHAGGLGVSVSISPQYRDGSPGSTLNYTVIVKNIGALDDNYDLTVSDNAGWELTVSPTSLTVPAGENRTSTLSVTISENALGCTRDNIAVTATSRTDNRVSASDTCVAHAVGVLTEARAVIYPAADIYAFGEYGIGYSRSQLKFDISGIPPGSNILLTKLWLCRLAADGWDGNVTLSRVDNQLWDETITASEFDAQTLTNEENQAGKFTSRGWDYLVVTSQLDVDYGAGNTYASFRLRWANDNGSEPSIGIDDGRFLVINSENNELCVIFSSSEYNGSDPYLEVVYVPPYAVSVSISPSGKSGLPTEVLNYTVTVRNIGNLDDNYILTVSDNMGWGLTVSPTPLTVASGSTGEAMLTVTIPENAVPCTLDNIVVTATSIGDPAISASASCIAHRVKADFRLITLYKVSLGLDAYLGEGSKLVAKFYMYGGGKYQDQTVVCSENIPGHITLLENISRPGNGYIQRIKLVVVDNENNVLQTIKIFETSRTILMGRLIEIDLIWPFASMAERTQLMREMVDIDLLWPFAPVAFEDP